MKKLFRKLIIVLSHQKMPFYAVARGRNTGVFLTWPECHVQVLGFRNPLFRKFQSFGEAEHFVMINGGTMPSNDYRYSNDSSSDYDSNSDDNDTIVFDPNRDNNPLITSNNGNSGVKDIVYSDNVTNPQERIKALRKYIEELSAENKKEKKAAVASTSSGAKPLKRLPDSNSSSLGGGPSSEKCSKPNENSLAKSQMKKYGKYSFMEDANGYVQVYTDGSCENNGRPNSIAGLGVYFCEGHALNTSQPVSGRATNNCGEIQASTLAIKLAAEHNVPKLCINTDSKFLINAMTQWINGWKSRGWRLKDGKPVKNEIDFKQLDNTINNANIDIKWNYVKAHYGILGNERADALAREGGQMYKRLHQNSNN